MRTLISFISRAALALTLTIGLAHAGTPLSVKVTGMASPSSAAKLKQKVSNIRGVERCDVNVEQGTARVVVADGADVLAVAGQLEGAVNAAGLALAR